ncbi:MAG: WG repeat-containing protein, partial [Treponema sp.]|nr:WG repeat-containing protein [Treponema sp.]
VYSFLDKKGKQFSKYTFEKATSFYNGYAMVIVEGKDALLDSAGKIIYVSDILNK